MKLKVVYQMILIKKVVLIQILKYFLKKKDEEKKEHNEFNSSKILSTLDVLRAQILNKIKQGYYMP